MEGTRRQGPGTQIRKVLTSISSNTLKQQLESLKRFVPGPLHISDDFQLSVLVGLLAMRQVCLCSCAFSWNPFTHFGLMDQSYM